MHKLAIVAISGLAVSAICLGAAISMGAHTGNMNVDLSFLDGLESCATTNATATSRTFDWTGSDEVGVSVPVNLHYKPGQGTQVVATGDPELLSHLKVHGEDIEMDCSIHHWNQRRLDITLPGNRTFREVDIKGVGSVDLQDINQPELEIGMAGKSDVTVTGKTDKFTVSLAGHGDIHARGLIAKSVEVNIAGHGDVETSPQDSADISIAGHGDVKLFSEPKHIETSIIGAGNVEHLAPKG